LLSLFVFIVYYRSHYNYMASHVLMHILHLLVLTPSMFLLFIHYYFMPSMYLSVLLRLSLSDMLLMSLLFILHQISSS
jgi:uncharacterized membrane protein (DUF106 family)